MVEEHVCDAKAAAAVLVTQSLQEHSENPRHTHIKTPHTHWLQGSGWETRCSTDAEDYYYFFKIIFNFRIRWWNDFLSSIILVCLYILASSVLTLDSTADFHPTQNAAAVPPSSAAYSRLKFRRSIKKQTTCAEVEPPADRSVYTPEEMAAPRPVAKTHLRRLRANCLRTPACACRHSLHAFALNAPINDLWLWLDEEKRWLFPHISRRCFINMSQGENAA